MKALAGLGKYDEATTLARAAIGGSTILIVIDGRDGSCCSVQATTPEVLKRLPTLLEQLAASLRGVPLP